MGRAVQINVRLDEEVASLLEQIAQEEAVSKTDVTRRYVIEGIKRWRIERAIEQFRKHVVSLERAAEIAELSIYEMMEQIRQRGVALDLSTPGEARQEIRDLLRYLAEHPGISAPR